mmetsp:Transcript_46173/g.130542  ORF Transcript_46173/g.130542 Transcript_46173/m.130542 type:complete len:325 (-) Transcript_46173:452-1426(-)
MVQDPCPALRLVREVSCSPRGREAQLGDVACLDHPDHHAQAVGAGHALQARRGLEHREVLRREPLREDRGLLGLRPRRHGVHALHALRLREPHREDPAEVHPRGPGDGALQGPVLQRLAGGDGQEAARFELPHGQEADHGQRWQRLPHRLGPLADDLVPRAGQVPPEVRGPDEEVGRLAVARDGRRQGQARGRERPHPRGHRQRGEAVPAHVRRAAGRDDGDAAGRARQGPREPAQDVQEGEPVLRRRRHPRGVRRRVPQRAPVRRGRPRRGRGGRAAPGRPAPMPATAKTTHRRAGPAAAHGRPARTLSPAPGRQRPPGDGRL